MPFQFIKNDIAKVRADALVNAVNPLLKGSADGCAPGEAKLIEGYALPCRYVIHAVAPQWGAEIMGSINYWRLAIGRL